MRILPTLLLALFAACGPAFDYAHIAPEARKTRPASPIPVYPECVEAQGKKVWGWFGRVQGTLDFHEFKTAQLSE